MIKKSFIAVGVVLTLCLSAFIILFFTYESSETPENTLGNSPFKLTVNISKKDLQIGDPFKLYAKLYSRNNVAVSYTGINKSNIKNAILNKTTSNTTKSAKAAVTTYTYYLQAESLKPIEIPSIIAQSNTLTQKSKPLTITPKSVLNKNFKEINDIKPINQYFIIKLWYLLIPLVLVILVVLTVYMVKKLVKTIKSRTKPEKILLPQDIALEELNKLRENKLSTTEEFDEFHTKLSEIIRKYMEGRFKIKAVERTTEELFPEILNLEVDNKYKTYIKQVLKESDLVKFAQYRISKDRSHLYLENAFEFVNRTMIEPVTTNNKKDIEYVSI